MLMTPRLCDIVVTHRERHFQESLAHVERTAENQEASAREAVNEREAGGELPGAGTRSRALEAEIRLGHQIATLEEQSDVLSRLRELATELKRHDLFAGDAPATSGMDVGVDHHGPAATVPPLLLAPRLDERRVQAHEAQVSFAHSAETTTAVARQSADNCVSLFATRGTDVHGSTPLRRERRKKGAQISSSLGDTPSIRPVELWHPPQTTQRRQVDLWRRRVARAVMERDEQRLVAAQRKVTALEHDDDDDGRHNAAVASSMSPPANGTTTKSAGLPVDEDDDPVMAGDLLAQCAEAEEEAWYRGRATASRRVLVQKRTATELLSNRAGAADDIGVPPPTEGRPTPAGHHGRPTPAGHEDAAGHPHDASCIIRYAHLQRERLTRMEAMLAALPPLPQAIEPFVQDQAFVVLPSVAMVLDDELPPPPPAGGTPPSSAASDGDDDDDDSGNSEDDATGGEEAIDGSSQSGSAAPEDGNDAVNEMSSDDSECADGDDPLAVVEQWANEERNPIAADDQRRRAPSKPPRPPPQRPAPPPHRGHAPPQGASSFDVLPLTAPRDMFRDPPVTRWTPFVNSSVLPNVFAGFLAAEQSRSVHGDRASSGDAPRGNDAGHPNKTPFTHLSLRRLAVAELEALSPPTAESAAFRIAVEHRMSALQSSTTSAVTLGSRDGSGMRSAATQTAAFIATVLGGNGLRSNFGSCPDGSVEALCLSVANCSLPISNVEEARAADHAIVALSAALARAGVNRSSSLTQLAAAVPPPNVTFLCSKTRDVMFDPVAVHPSAMRGLNDGVHPRSRLRTVTDSDTSRPSSSSVRPPSGHQRTDAEAVTVERQVALDQGVDPAALKPAHGLRLRIEAWRAGAIGRAALYLHEHRAVRTMMSSLVTGMVDAAIADSTSSKLAPYVLRRAPASLVQWTYPLNVSQMRDQAEISLSAVVALHQEAAKLRDLHRTVSERLSVLHVIRQGHERDASRSAVVLTAPGSGDAAEVQSIEPPATAMPADADSPGDTAATSMAIANKEYDGTWALLSQLHNRYRVITSECDRLAAVIVAFLSETDRFHAWRQQLLDVALPNLVLALRLLYTLVLFFEQGEFVPSTKMDLWRKALDLCPSFEPLQVLRNPSAALDAVRGMIFKLQALYLPAAQRFDLCDAVLVIAEPQDRIKVERLVMRDEVPKTLPPPLQPPGARSFFGGDDPASWSIPGVVPPLAFDALMDPFRVDSAGSNKRTGSTVVVPAPRPLSRVEVIRRRALNQLKERSSVDDVLPEATPPPDAADATSETAGLPNAQRKTIEEMSFRAARERIRSLPPYDAERFYLTGAMEHLQPPAQRRRRADATFRATTSSNDTAQLSALLLTRSDEDRHRARPIGADPSIPWWHFKPPKRFLAAPPLTQASPTQGEQDGGRHRPTRPTTTTKTGAGASPSATAPHVDELLRRSHTLAAAAAHASPPGTGSQRGATMDGQDGRLPPLTSRRRQLKTASSVAVTMPPRPPPPPSTAPAAGVPPRAAWR